MGQMLKKKSTIECVMHFAFSGAKGKAVQHIPMDWPAFFHMAQEHNVCSLVACALLHSANIGCPAPLKEYFINTMRQASAKNLVRRQRVLSLITEMQELGISIQILKGYAIASHYLYPECRDSTDTDLLVDNSQEKAVYEFLCKKGFDVTPRSNTSHHGICQHPKYGVIEIHTRLYDELVEVVWFRGMTLADFVKEDSNQIYLEGNYIKTLGVTDHLIFLTLHAIKHFISSGFTIRMLLDIAIYFESNRKNIDCERYWRVIDGLKYRNLVNLVLEIAVIYGGFDKDCFPGSGYVEPEHVRNIISDLVQGGYMGSREIDERQDSCMEYNRRLMRMKMSQRQYVIYMIKWKIRSALVKMFPNRENLIKEYPIASKSCVIRGILRVYQAFFYPVQKLCSGVVSKQIRSNKTSVTKEAQERIRLFEELGMF